MDLDCYRVLDRHRKSRYQEMEIRRSDMGGLSDDCRNGNDLPSISSLSMTVLSITPGFDNIFRHSYHDPVRSWARTSRVKAIPYPTVRRILLNRPHRRIYVSSLRTNIVLSLHEASD